MAAGTNTRPIVITARVRPFIRSSLRKGGLVECEQLAPRALGVWLAVDRRRPCGEVAHTPPVLRRINLDLGGYIGGSHRGFELVLRVGLALVVVLGHPE